MSSTLQSSLEQYDSKHSSRKNCVFYYKSYGWREAQMWPTLYGCILEVLLHQAHDLATVHWRTIWGLRLRLPSHASLNVHHHTRPQKTCIFLGRWYLLCWVKGYCICNQCKWNDNTRWRWDARQWSFPNRIRVIYLRRTKKRNTVVLGRFLVDGSEALHNYLDRAIDSFYNCRRERYSCTFL